MSRWRTILLISIPILSFIFAVTPLAHAQKMESGREQGTVCSLSFTPLYQFDADLDLGGKFSVSRYYLGFDASHSVSDAWRIGVGVVYDFEKYNFSGTTGFAEPEPWDEIHRLGFSLPVGYRFGKGWSLFFSPQVEFYGESGVDDLEDALSYGAAFGFSYRVNPTLTIGLGAGVFSRIKEERFFPFITIDWKITDDLRLSNPLRVSPAGPAGLELSYRIAEGWEIGAGGAYRSLRFRLDDSGFAPSGIGEVESLIGWGRLTYRPAPRFRLDLYAGAAFNGEMNIEDKDANHLASDDFETAPIAALTLTAEF